jgi:hypothetical protein
VNLLCSLVACGMEKYLNYMKTLFALLIIIPAAAFAGDNYSSFTDREYGLIRDHIIADGWVPKSRLVDDGCYKSSNIRCVGYPEAADCAGTGSAPCVMKWERNSEHLTILTNGEWPITVSITNE